MVWNMLFLSDNVNAEGGAIETRYLKPPEEEILKQSTFDFAEEWPTASYFNAWKAFWKDHALDTYKLSTPLGQWMYVQHRACELFHDA